MKVDYHLHTRLCGHAEGEMREYIEVAKQKGLEQVGFADHMPLLHIDIPSLAMSREELPVYVESVTELKEEFDDIEVKLGIEADYLPDTTSELATLLTSYDFDYIYGSVHFLDGWIFDSPHPDCIKEYEKHDIDDLYRRYFEVLGEAVETGLFDILAHPDLLKKFDKRPRMDPRPLYVDLLERVKEKDICYEVSTAGLRWPAAELYPEKSFVEAAFSLGVPVTLGSDAHRPDQVASAFDEALSMLHEVGYRELATFSGRERRLGPLG